MRNWILGGLLACVSSAGVAYVLARNSTGSHCGPCIETSNQLKDRIPADSTVMGDRSWSELEPCDHCSKCKEGNSKVVDVVDLDRSFRMADGSPKPVVSFEEPPLAKPRGEVTPVKFEVPTAVEVLPMPREVEPYSAGKTLPSPHYLKHYPNYFSSEPSPELAPMPREAVKSK
jgi:hypothetical protein